MIIRPTRVYLQADKIVYMNRAIYLHRKRETSVTKTVNLADVYPLQSIEERMMILQLIGAPKGLIDAEIAAYKWRLAIHEEEETLKHGDMEAYQQVLVKNGSRRRVFMHDTKSRAIVLAGNQNFIAQLSTTIKSIFTTIKM